MAVDAARGGVGGVLAGVGVEGAAFVQRVVRDEAYRAAAQTRQAGDADGGIESRQLRQCVLSGVGVKHQQHFMRRAGHRFVDDPLHLADFFHQIELRRQSARGVRQHDVDAAGLVFVVASEAFERLEVARIKRDHAAARRGGVERAGDEAERVAKRTKRLIESSATHNINVAEIRLSGQMAISLLRRSLDAFARLDTVAAAEVVQEDRQIDEEFRGFVRKLISYMMEDPRSISTGLDMLTIAKAIERIGDHAKNIAEFVIYIDKGSDVRHIPHEDLVREANRQ